MTLVPYTRSFDPFRIFENELANFRTAPRKSCSECWTPAVDITEDENQFIVSADIPGVSPKDIEINLEDGVLTVKGERSVENSEENNNYVKTERFSGSFARSFRLPDSVDAENISAKGTNGVLKITLPKQEKEKPKKITIN